MLCCRCHRTVPSCARKKRTSLGNGEEAVVQHLKGKEEGMQNEGGLPSPSIFPPSCFFALQSILILEENAAKARWNSTDSTSET